MRILRAFKTELDPNDRQRTAFVQYAGAARFCFNWGLAAMKEAYEQERKTRVMDEKKRLNAVKAQEFPWLGQVPYTVLESAFDNLDSAYQNFFRRVKQGKEKPGFPKFKSRKRGIGGFTVRGSLQIKDGYIRIPTPRGTRSLGWIRLKERGYLPTEPAKLLSFNISERAGRWFVSAQVEVDIPDPAPNTGDPMGVDLGIKVLAACSDGTIFENPKALVSAERKLARLQRELARRKKGGKNWQKTKCKIARCHYRIACIRRHAQHQVSHYVTAKTKPRAVAIEDLNVKGMLQNGHLSKAVSDAGMYEVRRQIEYKAKWNGVEVVTASRWYPSSKTCSACGSVKPLLSLSERTFYCEECGATFDRDYNAAMNLAALAS